MADHSVAPTARSRCPRCRRPLSHCLCAHVTQVDNRTRVLILQHPDERRHPLNTARLAVLGLRRSQLLIGEHFPRLDDMISAQASACLLFPTGSATPLQPAPRGGPEPALLIVPDGTWRMARKIVRANPVLDTLPHLRLPPGPSSRYEVRKAREPGALATIEAIARALSLLEPERDFQPVLKPFHALVAQQLRARDAAGG